VIDLHCHILPGIDDGPETVEGSVALARAAVAAGIATVAATPHVNTRFQVRDEQLEALPGRMRSLREALDREGVELEVVQGAEVALSRLEELGPEQLRGLCLGSGRSVLVESPYATAVPFIDERLFGLHAKGFLPVLAHPERCPLFQAEPDRLERLVSAGAVCSVNAGSLVGAFGRSVQRFAYDLLRRGLVHALSSDAHDHERRPPAIDYALHQAEADVPGLAAQADRLTRAAPAAILAGTPVPPAPPLAGRSGGRLGRLLRRG